MEVERNEFQEKIPWYIKNLILTNFFGNLASELSEVLDDSNKVYDMFRYV